MPKESRRNERVRNLYHRCKLTVDHGKDSSGKKPSFSRDRSSKSRVSNKEYSSVIESCEEMLSNIRSQIDQLCAEYRHDVPSSNSSYRDRTFDTFSGLVSIDGGSDRQDVGTSTISHLLPRLSSLHCSSKAMPSPRKGHQDAIVRHLEETRTFKASETKKSIDQIMSLSSTCQLQLLEVSLQCPLSQAKIKVPVKTSTCQHLGCFDANTFLTIMLERGKEMSTWKCPICSASADLDKLVVDGFLQEIINTTPKEATKIEFTSSGNWRLKKESGTPLSAKSKEKEYIDLTNSPQPKSVFIDLTQSP